MTFQSRGQGRSSMYDTRNLSARQNTRCVFMWTLTYW